MYLVVEWVTMSAPHSKGRQLTGVGKVLSTMSGTPWAWAACANFSMSSTVRAGLAMVSPNTTLVLGRNAAFSSDVYKRQVVDATRALLVNVLPYHPFLIKPNNHELGEIVGRELHTDEEIAAAARTLQEKGARNVLVSMAGDGALLLDEQGQVHRIGCPKGKVVNSVGAGDSMVAGFVAGWQLSLIHI